MRADIQNKVYTTKGFNDLRFDITFGESDGRIITTSDSGETVIFSIAGENLACIHKRLLDLARQVEDYLHDEFAVKYTRLLTKEKTTTD